MVLSRLSQTPQCGPGSRAHGPTHRPSGVGVGLWAPIKAHPNGGVASKRINKFTKHFDVVLTIFSQRLKELKHHLQCLKININIKPEMSTSYLLHDTLRRSAFHILTR